MTCTIGCEDLPKPAIEAEKSDQAPACGMLRIHSTGFPPMECPSVRRECLCEVLFSQAEP
jgi:hypothetical protein